MLWWVQTAEPQCSAPCVRGCRYGGNHCSLVGTVWSFSQTAAEITKLLAINVHTWQMTQIWIRVPEEVIKQVIYKCSIDDGDNWNLSRWDGRDMARQPWQCAEDRVVPRNMINPPLTSDTGYLKFTGHETTKLMVFFLGCWSRPKPGTLNNTINNSTY